MADVLTGRYHFGSGVSFGFSRPEKSALGFPDPVQGIHSSGLGSMSPPILGVGGFEPRTTLGLGGGGTLMVGGGPPLCAVGEVGSPVLRDWVVDPVSVMTYGLYALDGGSQTLVHCLVDSVLPGRVIGLLGYACCALSGRPPTGNAVRLGLYWARITCQSGAL